MHTDEKYMNRCLALAKLGASTVSPNPMVGAVVVLDGIIIGEGYTSPYGGSHAEVNAVQQVLDKYGNDVALRLLAESTIYVSLEPCAHFGKTPPCADLLVKCKLKRVVVGCLDPFAKVNGLGVQKLRDAGIDVSVGILEKQCYQINIRFFTRIKENRPYIILKWAQTKDGYFAPEDGSQKWITNRASKQLVHKWRAEEDAILVGKNTVIADNPSLNTRLWAGKSPKRILIDKNLEIPKNHDIYQNSSTDLLIFNALETDWNNHIKKIYLENFDLYLPQNIAYQLYLMDVQSLIVEGGAKTLQTFIDAGMWDEARVFDSEQKWNAGLQAPILNSAKEISLKIGSDILNIYKRVF